MKIFDLTKLYRPILAVLLPLAALIIQWIFWPFVQPFVWFFFYPAVFFSSWIDGIRGAIASTLISATIVVYFFMAPRYSFVLENPMGFLSVGVFIIMGCLFGYTQELLKKANRQINKALYSVKLANDQLETNVKERTASLAISEERFRSLYENSTIGIYRTTPDGKILLANPALVTLLGYSSFEELSRRNLEADGFEPSYERSHFLELIKKDGEIKGMESAWKRTDGKILFVSESAKAIYDKDGNVAFYDGIVEDITLRKQALEALTESEEKFRSIMENSADAIFLTDQQGRYTYTNKAVTSLLGFTEKEMKSKTILDLTPAGKADEYINLFKSLIITGSLYTELDLVRKEGGNISTDLNAVLLPDGIVYASCRDITERKHEKQELIKHRDHLEELINERTKELRTYMEETSDLYENAPCGYHSLDADGKFVRINNTELKWLGYERFEVINSLVFTDLLTLEGLRTFKANFKDLMKLGEISNIELELIRKDSSTFFVSANATAIYNNDGTFSMSRTTLFDITYRKATEEALNKAKKEAEEANKAKSEFLANMSHEIRTPMNAVLGYTELLGNTLVDPIQKDYVSSIKSSGRSLLTLINDILDLSKIEAGKLELEYDFIETYSFFSEFEKIFSLKVSEKGLKFILNISSGTPHGIYIDEARVRQIVFNLIGNAIKFTSEGRIELKVFTENPQIVRYSKEKSEELIDLIIEVVDTGIGISKDLQEAIFEPFVQERGYKHYGGTGLGLAISKRLVGLMEGNISVRSVLGKGCAFTVRIPEIAYQRDFSGTKIDVQIDPAEIAFEKAVILIADDVEHNRSYLREALKNSGLKIVEAEDGYNAYKIAKEIVPDLIIADIRMPKMDGFQLLNKIKAGKKLRHIPVIAYSASVIKAQKERIHNSEFASLLIKPVKVTELYLELMNILPYKSTKKTELVNQILEVDSDSKVIDLPGLIHSLSTDLNAIWKTFTVTQPIGGIRDFGTNLVQLGTDHNSRFIKDYGKQLINAADSYNIEAILKLIGNYSGIIEIIKDSNLK
jgi:PAS domain S-box-containing protein